MDINELVQLTAQTSSIRNIAFPPDTLLPTVFFHPDVKYIAYIVEADRIGGMGNAIYHVHRLLQMLHEKFGISSTYTNRFGWVSFRGCTQQMRVLDINMHQEQIRGLRFDVVYHFIHGLLFPVAPQSEYASFQLADISQQIKQLYEAEFPK